MSTIPLILNGSARHDGNMSKVTRQLMAHSGGEEVVLLDLQLEHYTYGTSPSDDFLPLIQRFLQHHDTLVLATPVYWYAMSGRMKVFFDRLTDLLTAEKTIGRQLRGKNMAVVTTSAGGNLGDDFWIPFQASADYLGMHYLGGWHTTDDSSMAETVERMAANL
ncbi:MAG: flavodoxin family protein [Salibacteraceae bacterium]